MAFALLAVLLSCCAESAAAEDETACTSKARATGSEQRCRDASLALCGRVAECAPPLFAFLFGRPTTCEGLLFDVCGASPPPTACERPGLSCDAIRGALSNIEPKSLFMLCADPSLGMRAETGGACGSSKDCLYGWCKQGRCTPLAVQGETCPDPNSDAHGVLAEAGGCDLFAGLACGGTQCGLMTLVHEGAECDDLLFSKLVPGRRLCAPLADGVVCESGRCVRKPRVATCPPRR